MQPFLLEEIKSAVFSMHLDKALGIDGLNPGFYRHYWNVISAAVTEECIHILNNGCLPEEHGNTAIVLFPKKKNPQSMKEFRPISLCQVAYKMVTKVLANRLKVLLPTLISEMQFAFIPNR